jgi:hypothetical protein
MGRKLRAGQHLSSDNIIAFEANTSGLQLLRGVYTLSHKKISEIDAHRPAKRTSMIDGRAISNPFRRYSSPEHERVGAPYTPFDMVPLKVHSALLEWL